MTDGKLYVIMHLQIQMRKAEVEAKSADYHEENKILQRKGEHL